MRLLSYNSTGLLSLTNYPRGTNIPPYAILSHTWGSDEVTYEDLGQGIGEHKLGFEKIRLCGEQAKRDGLQHFWVDTCCIDTSSSAELTESINSMFRWYRDATKCYAYLEDVSSPTMQDGGRHNNRHCELQLEQSRWFTRGWTLQELIAPKTVDFYSREGTLLGDKKSLERIICDITGIPARALRGKPLFHFTTSERMAWAEGRKTTVPEDKVYSMLGIFETQMPVIYGEGEERALKRLREEIVKDQKGSRHEEFSVPFSLHRVPEIAHFVARGKELAEMHERLQSDGGRRVVVLHGLGGMGKTQLAIEYMKRHKDNYSAVFWLNIKDENSLKQSFARIAHQIKRHHPSASQVSSLNIQENLDKTIDAVKAWLSLPNNSRWLLVYDNHDNPKLPSNTDPTALNIHEYFPESDQGFIIITTRSSQVKIGHAIQMVKIQNLDDSLKILSTTSKREELMNEPDAVNLAKELDGFPLALATAGAYLEQTSTTFGSYLRSYKDSWEQLQIISPELDSYENRTLYSTWQLSFDQIQRQNKHSAALLQLWAYFDNRDIWLELLRSYRGHSVEWIHEITKDELSFTHTIRTLTAYGLVEVDPSTDELIESRGYSVHSCVHSWMTHVLNREWSVELAKFAILCIASHIPNQDSDKWWLTQRRLLQHAAKQNKAVLYGITDDEASWVFDNWANLYSDQGKIKEAEEMYQQALKGYQTIYGLNHPKTQCILDKIKLLTTTKKIRFKSFL
ncbi:kinesin light chain [Hypoxylon argillaceum]|nr:kinesin light chain [Hypoxylon argillaceum]